MQARILELENLKISHELFMTSVRDVVSNEIHCKIIDRHIDLLNKDEPFIESCNKMKELQNKYDRIIEDG